MRVTRPAITTIFVVMVLQSASGRAEPQQATTDSSTPTRAEIESLLLTGEIVSDRNVSTSPEQGWRIVVDDGRRRHAAFIETAAGGDTFQRHHELNVAAYDLDKLLQLNMVAPAVERVVQGRPVSVSWGVDAVLMDEMTRAMRNIAPPDADKWNKQMQVVRVFDELTANAYRSIDPSARTTKLWDNLLITRDWTVWLIDHTRTFSADRQLAHPESLVECDRSLFTRLRALNRALLSQRLEPYLSAEQIDALDARRVLIVNHFNDQIASRGENVVLFDLLPSR